MRTKLAASSACLTLLLTTTASDGAEGGFYSGPIGGSDIRSAFLSDPGSLSLNLAGSPQWSNLYTGPNGGSAPSARSVAFSVQALVGGLNYVYPWTLAGGKFGSKIQDQYVFGCFRKNSSQQCDSGFTDPYADILIYSVHLGLLGAHPPAPGTGHLSLPYGLTVAPAFSMSLPVGRYNVRDLLNQGHNVAIFVPNISLTYTTGPDLSIGDATEISTRIYYEVSADNPKTGYRNGATLVDDFALSERVHDWQFGVSGTVAEATTNDTLHGASLPEDGNRLFDFLIGPVLQCDVPAWHSSFGIKALYDVASHNRLEHNLVVARATISLF